MPHVTLARSKRAFDAQGMVALAAYLAATFQALTLGLLVAIVQQGGFTNFDSSRLIGFVPSHLLLWRATWCSAASASLALLLLFVAIRQCIDRKYQTIANYSLALVIIGVANSLNADASVLIMFSDLAQELNLNYSLNHLGTVHLSWATISQFLSQELLISNGLFSIGGLLLALNSFLSRGVPRIVAWGALLTWLIALNASAVTASGNVDLGMSLYAAGKVSLIVWLALTGTSFTVMRQKLLRAQEVPVALVDSSQSEPKT